MPMDLRRLFEPRGVAILGASPDPAKVTGRPLSYFVRYGFAGAIHPVNPRYPEILGLRCYAEAADVPDPVDLAVILRPAPEVPEALAACGKRGIPFAVAIAGGFAEAGHPELQASLTAICKETGIRLVGPNCVGLLNPRGRVTANFSTVVGREMPPSGGLALVTQSGALGNALLQSCIDYGIGLRAWVSTGNEADLGALDFVDFLIDDDETQVIGLFLEGLKDGVRLAQLGRRALAAKKPIIVLRAGKSELGRRASISHTGKLAGSMRVWRDVVRQAGCVEVETLDDLVDLFLGLQTLGLGFGEHEGGMGVLTISGGLGVMIADDCAQKGLDLPRFTETTQQTLRGLLPDQSSVANPVDTALFADVEGYGKCAEAVIDDAGIGVLCLVMTTLVHDYEKMAPWVEALATRAQAQGKQLVITYLSSSDPMARALRLRFAAKGVLVLPTPERMVSILAHRKALRRRMSAKPALMLAPVPSDPETFLAAARVPLARETLCGSAKAARAAAAALGFPVVLKVASPDIAHKTEVGGVKVGLRSPGEVARAFAEIKAAMREKAPKARIQGISVQEMVMGGAELIVGCSSDPEFGPILMVGAGGIWAELLGDVTFRALPVGHDDVRAMIEGLAIHPLLAGARGRPALDVDAAADAIARIAAAFAGAEGIAEVDVNPLIVLPRGQGVCAVDTLIVPSAAKRGGQDVSGEIPHHQADRVRDANREEI